MLRDLAETVKSPRTLHLKFPYGSPVGKPNDKEQQINVLREALKVIEEEKTPGVIVNSEIKYR